MDRDKGTVFKIKIKRMNTITIEQLRKINFFEKVDVIKALIAYYYFECLYISPPIHQQKALYLMLDCGDNKSWGDFVEFCDAIDALLKESLQKEGFGVQVFDIFAAEKVVSEEQDSDFYPLYKRALDESILVENLSSDIVLSLQWRMQAITKNSKQNSFLKTLIEETPPTTSSFPLDGQIFMQKKENPKRNWSLIARGAGWNS